MAPAGTKSFDAVFQAELQAIKDRHNSFAGRKINETDIPSASLGLTGLACSGGGIRSAAFCLGVLQGLQSKKVIDRIDYLSTVSGGGYIGATLSIGMATGEPAAPGGTEATFPFGRLDSEDREPPEVKHLRDNSRYLVQNGIRSVLSAAVIYLRGLAMNTLVILPLLLLAAAVLMTSNPTTELLSTNRFFGFDLSWLVGATRLPVTTIGTLSIVLLLMLYAFLVSVLRIRPLRDRRLSAHVATVIFLVILAACFLELHSALLRLVLEAEVGKGKLMPASAQAGGGVFDFLYRNAERFVTFASPLVAAVLPFWKTLAATASKEAASWQDTVKQLASRIILILAAAVIPVLLWLVMMQLAFWGTAVSTCGFAQTSGCAYNWSHAPSFMQTLADTTSWFWFEKWRMPTIYTFAALVVIVAVWPRLSVNSNSLHQLYRDRLGSAFLIRRRKPNDPNDLDPELRDVITVDNFRLTKLNAARGPYHIINTALNVPGSRAANRRGRNADFFIFSQRFIGSEITGYAPTEEAEKVVDGLNIGTAVAISGAAAAPNMGLASIRPLSATIALLNVRLGRWVRHPLDIVNMYARLPDNERQATTTEDDPGASGWLTKRRFPGPLYLLREAFFKSGRDADQARQSWTSRLHACVFGKTPRMGFVFLSDGGHIENLGVYELLRRRCKLIISIDGEADPGLQGPSLTQLERLARIDHNISLRMQWKPIGEMTRAVASSATRESKHGPHVALGLIDYPPLPGKSDRETGVLVYIKASLSGDENDYVMAYNALHKDFPHETTADQLFSEEQFEVYRALGEHIAIGFVTGRDPVSVDPNNARMLVGMVNRALEI